MIEPYYDYGGITIYLGDCREILPELVPVDFALVDPPYGIGESGKKNKSRELLAKPRDYGSYNWDKEPVEQELIDRIIRYSKYSAIFGGNYYRMDPSPSWLVWDKQNTGDFADCELCWTNFGCAARIKHHLWNGMIRKGREDRFHPTQKPLEVIKWVIQLCPGNPKLILDPMMGSGTTLRAAKDLNLKAIGIEISENYCEIAANRLRQEVLMI